MNTFYEAQLALIPMGIFFVIILFAHTWSIQQCKVTDEQICRLITLAADDKEACSYLNEWLDRPEFLNKDFSAVYERILSITSQNNIVDFKKTTTLMQ